jgi:hypothetical protein
MQPILVYLLKFYLNVVAVLYIPHQFRRNVIFSYSFFFQKAFVTERADLSENNKRKWETSMQQRRDKEVNNSIRLDL